MGNQDDRCELTFSALLCTPFADDLNSDLILLFL